jgi:hypothetical protein
MRQMVRTERCKACAYNNVGCFVSNRLDLAKTGCYRCPENCSLGSHARKDIDYYELLPNGQVSEEILQPQTKPKPKPKPAAVATKIHRTVYSLETGPKGSVSSDQNVEENEVCYPLPRWYVALTSAQVEIL